MPEEEVEIIANRIKNDMRKRMEFCDNVGITLDDYYIKQCGDFEIEDMVRAFENGKSFYEEIINDYGKTKEQLVEKDKQITNLQTMLQAEREVRCNEEYLKKITELEAQIEKMKCCGNCKHQYEGQYHDGFKCKDHYKEEVCESYEWELAE